MKSLFTIQGIVQEGHNRGKRLGFPTINFPVAETLPEGIYVSQTTVQANTYHSLTFIGAAKTYHETSFQAETYLFDFEQDIYGKTVTINLLKKIRDNQKFHSEEALVKQMEEDKRQAEEFFKKSINV